MLLISVAIAFYWYDPIASMYQDKDTAARNIGYVFSGLLKALLFCTVWALTPWSPLSVRLGVSLVCGWGAWESLLESACMMAIGIQNEPPTTGLYRGLCDVATGIPIYMPTLLMVVLVFAWGASRKRG